MLPPQPGAVPTQHLGGHNVQQMRMPQPGQGGTSNKWPYLAAIVCVAWACGGLTTLMWWVVYGAVGFIVMLYVNQNKMLYAPAPPGVPKLPKDNPKTMRSPEEHGLDFEDLRIDCEDGVVISAWLIKQKGLQKLANAPTLIYFHGNAGNIGMRLKFYKDLHDQAGCNILAVDYRGYGNSGGLPSEPGLNRDADAALKYVKARKDLNQGGVFLFGRSLGGAVAISLASRHAEDEAIRVSLDERKAAR